MLLGLKPNAEAKIFLSAWIPLLGFHTVNLVPSHEASAARGSKDAG